MALYLCDLPPQTHHSGLIMRKTNRLTLFGGHSTKYLTSVPQNCQGHLNKESLRNCQHPREKPKELLTAKCDMVSWTGSGDRKRTLDEN